MSTFRLSDEQKDRLKFVFEGDPSGDMVDRLAVLQTPLELHQFALNYNVNDSFRPSRAVIRNPLCDRGTALWVYWLFPDIVYSRKQHVMFPDSEDWQENWGIGLALVEELEQRYSSGFYRTQLFAFDPGLSRVDVYCILKDNSGRLPFPVEMLIATPGEKIQAEWCF